VEGEIVAWHIRPGDRVEEDQPLLDVMTDKATVTIPSPVAGKIVRTHGELGDAVPVGSDLVVMETAAVPCPAANGQSKADCRKPTAETLHGPRPALGIADGTRIDPAKRPAASPAVRRRARDHGVRLDEVQGSGQGGRITDADLDAFIQGGGNGTAAANNGSPQERSGTTEVHLAGLRRRIAEKMAISHTNIPHFSYIEEVDITELVRLRTYLNEKRPAHEPKLSYLPFIMLALVKALRAHPESNAHYDDQREVLTQFEAVHVGIATQTERGLYVPVVRHVEAKDLWEIARHMQRVTQATHNNTIQREELTGSTITLTSLGSLGGLAATPIINHPEVAILGIHRAQDRPVVIDGQIVVRHMVNVSASFDHRVIDGADGAAMIQHLKEFLEHPAVLFI